MSIEKNTLIPHANTSDHESIADDNNLENHGTVPATTATGSPVGAVSTMAHVDDEVTTGGDGFEYHHATPNAVSHELHGSDTVASVLVGGSSDDVLVAGTQAAILDGGRGSNTLKGGVSNDILVAGGADNQGQNHLEGGQGDDIFIAGGAKTQELDDFLSASPSLVSSITADPKYASLSSIIQSSVNHSGGGATNTFSFQSGSGRDLIYNFHAQTDVLEIHRGLNGSDIQDVESLLHHISVSGNDMTLDLGAGNSIGLIGVDVAHLSAANVTFI